MDPEEIDWQDDGRERGDEPQPKFVSKMCEGQMVSYAHLKDVREYQLFDKEGNKDTKGFLCSRCVLSDREKGYDWRLIPEDKNV